MAVSDQEILDAHNKFPESQRKAAKSLGMVQSAFCTRLKKIKEGSLDDLGETPLPSKKVKGALSSNKGWLELTDFDMPSSDEIFEKYGLDPECWEIKKIVPNQWQGFYKKERLEQDLKGAKIVKVADDHVIVTLHSLKVFIERVIPVEIEAVAKTIAERIQPLPKPRKKKKRQGTQLAVMGLYDAHIGALCWDGDTDSNNDTGIAEKRCYDAIDDLMDDLSLYPIGKLVVPIGNDFCHIDNQQGTTSSGTPLDFDSRYAKVIESCHRVLTHLGDRALELCDDVLFMHVGGNHDWVTSLHFAHWMKQRYRHDDRVIVDTEAKPRKYMMYEGNLLGFAHGDRLNPSNVYRHMAEEAREHWSHATCREFHTGDKHHRKQIDQKIVDTYGRVTFRQNPTLAPRDAWTFKMGFDSVRCADAYRYSPDGFAGLHTCYARKEQ